jgi:hypothetical protein
MVVASAVSPNGVEVFALYSNFTQLTWLIW